MKEHHHEAKEAPKTKPADAVIELVHGMRSLVAAAEQAGDRDRPEIVKARELLARHEPKPKPEDEKPDE